MATIETLLKPQFRKMRAGRTQRGVDWLFMTAVIVLTLMGVMMAYSTTFYWSYHDFGDVFQIFLKQMQWTGVGLLAMVITSRLDYGIYRRLVLPIMASCLLVLIAILIFGDDKFNARRTFFDGSVQPSEVVKIGVILYAAAWLDSRRGQVQSFATGLAPFGMIVGVVAAFVYLQPDLSTTAVIVLSSCVMFFMAGASGKQIAMVVLIAAGAFLVAYQLFGHVSIRVQGFVANFGADHPTDMEWHVGQSLLTMGAGGLFGTGPGTGEKFGWLPTAHTDSVIAVLGNELGWLGVMAMLALFGLLVFRGFRIAHRADTYFGAFIAVGIITWIISQMFMNAFSSLAMIPFMGVPVPFLSVGGSSLVAVLAACGILNSISRGSRLLQKDPLEENEGSAYRARFADRYANPNPTAPARAGVRRRNGGTRVTRTHRAQGAERLAAAAQLTHSNTDTYGADFGVDVRIEARRITQQNQRVRRKQMGQPDQPVRWRGRGNGTRISLPRRDSVRVD